MQPMYLIVYVGSKDNAMELQERLGQIYRVEHRANDEGLFLFFFGGVSSPNLIIHEMNSFGSTFQNSTELMEFIRDGNDELPTLLLGDDLLGDTERILAETDDFLWVLKINDVDQLVKHIREVFATKH